MATKEQGHSRAFAWLLLGLVVLVIVIVAVVSLLQRPAPPGTEIVNQALPANHPGGPCYQCHEGMATGAEIQSKRLPDQHPAERCSQCHKGYGADPDRREPVSPLPPPGGSP